MVGGRPASLRELVVYGGARDFRELLRSDVLVTGAPAPLTTLVRALHAGGDRTQTSSPTAAAALGARTPVAVVTSGGDLTPAVRPTWKVVGGTVFAEFRDGNLS